MAITTIPNGALTEQNNLVLLSTATISSGDSEVVFDSTLINDTYNIYEVKYDNIILATDGTGIAYRYSEDNGSTYKDGTSSYRYVHRGGDTSDSNDSTHSRHSSSTRGNIVGVLNNLGNDTRENACGSVTFWNLRSTSSVFAEGRSVYESNNGVGSIVNFIEMYHDASLTVNNIKFFPVSGNFTSGTFTLFGVRT